jgi:hypothetical protein
MREKFLKSRRLLGTGLVCGLFVALCGCGARGTVTGRVKWKDQELDRGTVIFVTEDNHSFTGTIKDGTYTVEGCPAGPVKIGIVATGVKANDKAGGRKKEDFMKEYNKQIKEMPPGYKERLDPAQNKASIPDSVLQKYRDATKSGLTYVVQPGQQEYDIVLPEKAGK